MIDKSGSTTVTSVSWEIKPGRNWFLGFGIVSSLLGLAAIIFPFTAALTIELLIGWVLLISGIFGLLHAWRTSRWYGFHFSLLTSLVTIVIGLLLVLFPQSGILSLALLVALFFLASGMMRIMMAWRLKSMNRWLWLLFSGIVSLVLGLLILLLWPDAAGWVIGVLLGIDLLFSGLTLILISFAARQPETL